MSFGNGHASIATNNDNGLSRLLEFKHSPLPDPRTYLRLLEITQGGFGQHVICKLSTWSVDERPSYYAISYTWGPEESPATITIDGKKLNVRRNCEYVLQQAFSSKTSKYFWIDAICIDQAVDEDNQLKNTEKNHQVAMMGQIYQGAAHVVLCVGPHQEDSKYLLDFCEKHRSFLAGVSVLPSSSLNSWYPVLANGIEVMTRFFTWKKIALMRLIKAFVQFIQRPYFGRLWVLQESISATEASYFCGEDVRNTRYLLPLGLFVNEYLERISGSSLSFPQASYEATICEYSGVQKFMHTQYAHSKSRFLKCVSFPSVEFQTRYRMMLTPFEERMGCLYLPYRTPESLSLCDVMVLRAHFHCGDRRDHLYGIISLVDWRGRPRPIPDYQKTNFEVCVETLKYLILDEKHHLLEWIEELWRLFEVPLDDRGLMKAVHARSNRMEDTRTFNQEPGLKDRFRWVGIRIQSAHMWDEVDINFATMRLRASSSHPEEKFIKLRMWEGAYALLPTDTLIGDWFIWQEASGGNGLWDSNLVLVVRNSRGSHYAIVGVGYLVKKTEHSPLEGDLFDVIWKPEDFLVQYWNTRIRLHSSDVLEKAMEIAQVRVCGSPNSSYAVNKSRIS